MNQKENKEKGIALYRAEIKAQVMENKEVFNTLANSTFKGLDHVNIPVALLQGRMKGFELDDFMIGNVYALPFWSNSEKKQNFSLVSSIDHIRKIAMRSGQSGKSEPQYTFLENGTVETCSITIWKKDGDQRGYTAKVYFKEYNTGKNLWVSKPLTMIAKVAEMHALRAAFPEELQNAYVAEEVQQEIIVESQDINDIVDQSEIDKVLKQIKTLKSNKELVDYFRGLKKPLNQVDEIIDAFKEQKELCKKKATK